MDSKILNFIEAMEIAKLILKYFTFENVSNSTVHDFVVELIDRLDEDELIKLEDTMLNGFEKFPADIIFNALGEGFVKNNLMELLSYYKELGFK